MATKAKKKTTKKKAATTTKKAAAAPKQTEVLLVGSKVRQAIKDAEMNTGGDAIDGLNEWVHWLIRQATRRAQENGRKTVRAHDFMAPQ
jgi:histone H3/H4